MHSLLGLFLAASAFAQSGGSSGSGDAAPGVVYSPARPPAIPLAVRSPYTSVWSTTSQNSTLNSKSVMFWNGQTVGWEGVVVVDGIAYEWMGIGSQDLPELDSLKSATPLSVSYDSQYSNFTFSAGPVQLTAKFFSPVVPQDLCRTSAPLSYLEVSYESQDNKTHDVKLYNDVDSSWNNYRGDASIDFSLNVDAQQYKPNTTVTKTTLFTWNYWLSQEFDFTENNDFPQWGNMTLSTQPGDSKNFTFQSGNSLSIRYNYVSKGYLSNNVDHGDNQIFAYSHDFKQSRSGSVLYTVGVVQEPAINLLTSEGLQSLGPWWSSESCYGTGTAHLIATHYDDYTTVQAMAAAWESKLKSDINDYYAAESNNASNASYTPLSTPSSTAPFGNSSVSAGDLFLGRYETGTDQFGERWIFNSSNAYGYLDATNQSGLAIPDVPEADSYYAIVALSARQILGAYTLTVPPDFTCGNSSRLYSKSEPFMFQKEISSNGNMNTVDVLYPAMPFFLYANPKLLRYAINPLFLNQESGFYPRMYSMHDLGSHYPNATGHPDGTDEQMPVEESGNMLLMVYAYYKFTGDSQYLKDHYTKMYQWAQFLVEYTLIPSTQLSTDDFLGSLENQTNLAIKGIVGLQAMAEIADVAGNSGDAANFSAVSTSYYQSWEELAIDPTGTHTVLAYQWRSSWGLLYNSYPDKLLNLGVIRQEVYDMQSTFYATVSQVFGLPLDNRHSITKSDWEMWTAATCTPHTRRLIVNALAYWLNNTATDKAFTDLYETISTGNYPENPKVTFIARPVAGGHFSLLALQKAGEDASTGTGDGGIFPINGTEPLPPGDTSLLPISPTPNPENVPTITVELGTAVPSSSGVSVATSASASS